MQAAVVVLLGLALALAVAGAVFSHKERRRRRRMPLRARTAVRVPTVPYRNWIGPSVADEPAETAPSGPRVRQASDRPAWR